MNSDNDRAFTDELKTSAHKIWLAGLGALAVAEEEGSKLFRNLVEKGETYEAHGRATADDVAGDVKGRVADVRSKVEEATDKAREQMNATWDRVEHTIDRAMNTAFRGAGVPHRDEIATLTQRVEELTRIIEQLKQDGTKA